MRAWINGRLVVDQRGPRPLTFDEDQVEVDLNAGENRLLVKVGVTDRRGAAARVLERGAIPPRLQEIAPSFQVEGTFLVIKSDLNSSQAAEARVTVQTLAAGGQILGEKTVSRGETVRFDFAEWPDGAYEIRAATRKPDGLRSAAHLAWFKGDAIAAARELIAAAAKADGSTPIGQTVQMLGAMTLDRLGKEGLAITGNPWWAIHAPLMEFAELKLEASGRKFARARSGGFYRLAWRDEVDGSPQFARAYLPIGYDPMKKTPLVVRLHGFNPANPDYVQWWSVDWRHSLADVDYGQGEGVIYLEPHGRGNSQYLGIGDQDVVRAIQEAKDHFMVDEDRVYLCGESMGGWGVWNIGTRHPELFAALAPIYGGSDYHSYLTEEQLAALNPISRFLFEKDSTQSSADALLHLPVMVLHGDADQAVNVEWSQYIVRMLARWAYDVRYVELPGYGHEDISRFPFIFDWFLTHRRDSQPRQVRLRSAELRHATAYWLTANAPARFDDFMVADAAVVATNTIRLDTKNILALTLAPGPKLIDSAKPVTLVWNGVAQTSAMQNGKIRLQGPDFRPSGHDKNARLPGSLGDLFNLPFAIVRGTASADAAMNEACRRQTDAVVKMWRDWQRQPPRVWGDSDISETEASHYSLLLIGGPEANLVTRRFAQELPLRIGHDSISIGDRAFAVSDGRVELIRPNPLNPERYVLVAAATSAEGMRLRPLDIRNSPFDFVIEDGRVASAGQKANRTELWVAGGWFDPHWALDDGRVQLGDPDARAQALRLRGPLEEGVLDTFVGDYELAPGGILRIRRAGNRLTGQAGQDPPVELVPAGENTFFIFDGSTVIVFAKDATSKVASFVATRPNMTLSGKRIN
ncbi:MAG: prolyl oligopeptidase family serine peptidase [Verrucomicrobiota bacterium]